MDVTSAKNKAIELLSRREHSQLELKQKLKQRGFSEQHIQQALHELNDKKFQSDERFAESYIRARANKGFGPQRIKQELRERGINEDYIEIAFEQCEIDWEQLIKQVHRKKFLVVAKDFKKQAQQKNFLQYRGFYFEQIEKLFKSI